MYDVGILGGMGPRATLLMFEMLIENTAAQRDQDHLNIIILNRARIPDRTSYLLGWSRENPLPVLLEGIHEFNKLSVGRVVIPCNTSHMFYKELSTCSRAPIVNMVSCSLDFLFYCGFPGKVCIIGTLGTVKSRLYNKYNSHELQIIYPNENQNHDIHSLIYDIKANPQSPQRHLASRLKRILEEIVSIEKEVCFLIACTEISTLIRMINPEYRIIDAMEVVSLVSIKASGRELVNNKDQITNFAIDTIVNELGG